LLPSPSNGSPRLARPSLLRSIGAAGTSASAGESPVSLTTRPLCPLHPTIAGAPDTIDALIAGKLNGASVLGGMLLSNNAERLACPAPESRASNCPHDKVAANEHKEDIDQPKVWDENSKRNGCKQQESHNKKPCLAFLNHLPTTSWALHGCDKHSMRLTTNSPEALSCARLLAAVNVAASLPETS
jgi:hypothetical protein